MGSAGFCCGRMVGVWRLIVLSSRWSGRGLICGAWWLIWVMSGGSLGGQSLRMRLLLCLGRSMSGRLFCLGRCGVICIVCGIGSCGLVALMMGGGFGWMVRVRR